jgi:hypothetical protein
MNSRLPLSESRVAVVGGILLLALFVRLICSVLIGTGVFGPDGTGVEASVHLGGHPNVLFPWLVEFFGGSRGLSAFGGAVTAVACGKLGERLGGSLLVCGFMGACAPLLVLPASMSGGDAPAIAMATTGVAMALWNRPLAGGFLAGLSLGIKATALPLFLLLPAGLMYCDNKKRFVLRLGAGLILPIFLFASTLEPLLSPRPNSGILGSWWLGSQGHFPGPTDWVSLSGIAFKNLLTMPTWTGHPLLGLLAFWACLRSPDKRLWMVLFLSAAALFLTAAPLGEVLKVRYLAAGTVGITVLAGVALSRWKWAPFLFVWPCLAFATQLGDLRSTEEGTSPRPQLSWLRPINVEPAFEDGAICGGKELRKIAKKLVKSLPENAEVAAIRLRDGRESELFWKLRVARPDLHLVSIGAHCCPENDLLSCATRIRSHLYERGGALIVPHTPPNCQTHLASPSDLTLAEAFGQAPQKEERFSLSTWNGQGPNTGNTDSCGAIRGSAW